MAATPPPPLVDGLAEGLVLASLERQPATEEAIVDELTFALGQPEVPAQLSATVDRLRHDGKVASQGQTSPLSLTSAGERSLAAYRQLPPPLVGRLVDLLALSRSEPARRLEAGAEEPEAGWVAACLEGLPEAPSIQAPHAQVSLDRDVAAGGWVLRVRSHQPGRYPRAEACPLTFLYAASLRLLFDRGLTHPAPALQR